MLIGGLMLAGAATLSAVSPAFSALPAPSSDFTAQFMDISALLIPHRLDPVIGERTAAAMLARNPQLPEQIATLLDIAKTRNAKIVEDFFPDVPDGTVKDAALAIIAAWYMGVVSDETGAEVFAFEKALMFQPTRDVMTIPSYAKSGPNGWNAEAPALGDMPVF